ncbi:MAG: hypothetical protein ACOC0C_03530 [Bacteroidota bacterium]
MEVSNQPKLSFHGVDFLHVHFDALTPRANDMQIDIHCEPKIYYPAESANDFKIIMDLELKSERCFELSLRAVGNFELEKEIDDTLKKTFINSNAPAIMFPYVRSFITTLSSNLGNVIGPLLIPTQFFQGELDEFELDEK